MTEPAEYEDILPLVDLRIERAMMTTRHALRQDIEVLGHKLVAAQLAATQGTADVRESLSNIRADLRPLADLPARVTALERTDDIGAAMHRTLWKVAAFVVTVVAAGNGTVLLFLR